MARGYILQAVASAGRRRTLMKSVLQLARIFHSCWVARATCPCRRATSPAEARRQTARVASPHHDKVPVQAWSATCRPERAGSLCHSSRGNRYEIFGLALLISVLVTTAQAVPCILESTNHGGGWFSYTFRRGDDAYVWGVRTNAGMILLQAYGVFDVQDPPGWTHTISSSGVIECKVTNGIVFLDEPVTFWIRSCLTESASYTALTPGGPFVIVSSSVYALPERTQIVAGGYQAFDFVGPAPPALIIEQRPDDVIIRWSSDVQGLRLEAADRPDSSGLWSSITNEVTIENGKFTVILPAGDAARFFRLVTPCPPAAGN